MSRKCVLTAALAVALTGCAGLILEPQDSVGMKAAKVSTRVLLGITTFGMSEVEIDSIQRHRARMQYIQRLQEKIQTASKKAMLAEDEATRDYWLREHAWLSDELTAHRESLDAQAAALQQFFSDRRARRRNCVSRIDGGTVHTQCY